MPGPALPSAPSTATSPALSPAARTSRRPGSRPGLRRTLIAAALATALGVPLATPAMATPGPAPASATASATASPTLRLGARGPAVVTLQRLLRLPPVGTFGKRTKRSVVTFQRASGLRADGVVGARTWRALRARAVTRRTAPKPSRSTKRVSLGALAVAEAARHAGKPYIYGASGPAAFDCSGFVQYVYSRVGLSVPRTSGAQAAAARPVAQADRQPGDLVIFRSRSGRVYHVGLYAGDDTMWVARRTGTTITRQRLWTTAYSVGRFA
jgi:peptidoglycan DL-endopeptidase CwlO